MTLQIMFAGGGLGAFVCPPGAGPWDTDVQQCGGHVIALPRSPVWITFAGAKPILADRGQVMLHRDGQVYQRSSVGGNGDYCRYMSFGEGVLREIAAEFDPAAAGGSTFRFSTTHTGVPADVYAAFCASTTAGLADGDEIRIADACYRTARAAIATAAAMAGRSVRAGVGAGRRDLIEAAKCLIADDVGRSWTLAAIADALHVSPYHLTRSFRLQTGVPMHRYLLDARLRAGLELLLDGRSSTVTMVAHQLGFASHAHFTTSFRALFGMTPTAAQAAGQPRKILEAAAPPQL